MDASKLALLEAWGEGPFNIVPPPQKKKKTEEKEGASKSFLPGSTSSALPHTLGGT